MLAAPCAEQGHCHMLNENTLRGYEAGTQVCVVGYNIRDRLKISHQCLEKSLWFMDHVVVKCQSCYRKKSKNCHVCEAGGHRRSLGPGGILLWEWRWTGGSGGFQPFPGAQPAQQPAPGRRCWATVAEILEKILLCTNGIS